MIYLASSGDEVKIWDASDSFGLKEQFSPFETVSDICWGEDGGLLASCSKLCDSVHLRKASGSQSVPSDSFSVPNQAGVLCLDFSSDYSSRYLLCGCTDGIAHIWDRKSQKFKKSFSCIKSPITRARWNWNDGYIALGSADGHIILCNIISGVHSSPLNTGSKEPVSQLCYNPYSKSSLVSASESGVISMWDTNTHRLVHSFTSSHQAPARDIAFSPINDQLMMSVALDKRCVFYDIHNKKPLNTIVSDHPLTSVDMMNDGSTIAVGSSRGKIFIYDIRQDSSPVFSFSAHQSSVKCISFVAKESGKENAASRRQLPVAPSKDFVDLGKGLNQNNNHEASESSHIPSVGGLRPDILSPIKEGNSSSLSISNQTAENNSWNFMGNNQMKEESFNGELKDFPNLTSCISPLRDSSLQSSMDFSSNRRESLFSQMFMKSRNNSPQLEPSNISNQQTSTRWVSGSEREILSPRRSPRTPPNHRTSPRSFQNSIQQADLSPSAITLAKRLSPPGDKSLKSETHASLPQSTQENSLSSNSSYITHRRKLTTEEDSSGNRSDLSDKDKKGFHEKYSPREAKSSTNGNTKLNSSSSPRSLPHESIPTPSPPSSIALSSMRHFVRDLLKEQFKEHQENLKAEIREMVGTQAASGVVSQSGPNGVVSSATPRSDPIMFQAQFIRNLIREELEDMNEKWHSEFWDVKMLVLKQVFLLEKRIDAGFAECMINPLLLDEIERLKQENAELKKVF